MSARDQKWNVEEVSAFVFVVSPSNSKVQHLYTRATLLYIIRSTERLLLLYVQNIYVRMRDLAVHTYSRNLFQNALADSKNSQPYTFYILVQQYTCVSVCLAILFYFFMSNIRTHITERCETATRMKKGANTQAHVRVRATAHLLYVHTYVYPMCTAAVCILLCSRRKKARARGLLLMQRVSRYCCMYSQVFRPGPG